MPLAPHDPRELCLIQANCLGDPLTRLLLASSGFRRRYLLYRTTNYTREPIPDEVLSRCSLFLYQHLSAKWEELASQQLLARLPGHARSLRLPVPIFRGYWPFWTDRYPMHFADAFVEPLAEAGLSADEILLLYLKRNALAGRDLDGPGRESLAVLRAAEAEGALPIADFIEANWRRFPVFDTINHPALPLLHHIADEVLTALGLPPLDENARRLDVSCDEGGPARFELPIHPRVAAHHKLSFAGEKRMYRVYGARMTFARYAACYIDCRLLGLTDFISYLQQIGGKGGGETAASPTARAGM